MRVVPPLPRSQIWFFLWMATIPLVKMTTDMITKCTRTKWDDFIVGVLFEIPFTLLGSYALCLAKVELLLFEMKDVFFFLLPTQTPCN